MGFDDVSRLLEERRAAVEVELNRLEAEVERIAGLIASCRGERDELQIACRVVARLPLVRPVPEAVTDGNDPVSSDAPVEVFTPWVLGMLGRVGRPVRCQEVLQTMGEDPGVARNVERVRHRLKKLVRNGQLVESEPGMFTLAGIGTPPTG
jgi:hypothetical protein